MNFKHLGIYLETDKQSELYFNVDTIHTSPSGNHTVQLKFKDIVLEVDSQKLLDVADDIKEFIEKNPSNGITDVE